MTLAMQYAPVLAGATAPQGAGAIRAVDPVDSTVTAIDKLGAVVTASFTSGSNVMIVTGVAAGALALNQLITAANNVPPGVTIIALGTGAGGSGTYTMSANATATGTGVAVSTSYNVDYMRANWVTDPTKAFSTRLKNTATPGDGNAVIVASDANFNSQPTIDTRTLQTGAGFPLNEVCPPSFTFILAMRMSAFRAVNHLFATQAQGTAVYMNNGGQLRWQAATGDTVHNVGVPDPFMSPSTTYVFWVSYDQPTNTYRTGKAPTVSASFVQTVGRAATTNAADFARPMSYFSTTTPAGIAGYIQGWAITSKPYANDGSPADLATSSLISTWKTLIAAP